MNIKLIKNNNILEEKIIQKYKDKYRWRQNLINQIPNIANEKTLFNQYFKNIYLCDTILVEKVENFDVSTLN